jgi:hypothetical protein
MSIDAERAPVKRRLRQRDQRAARSTAYADAGAAGQGQDQGQAQDRGVRHAAPAPVPPAPARRPQPAPRELHARIDRVEVSGSLPAGAVQRAIERRRSAIESCIPPTSGTVVAHFTIGETRRAQDVHAVGSTAAIDACIGAALRDVRTENAPDVGDVEVTVRIAFVETM